MAVTNLGRVAPFPRGQYSALTEYNYFDLVIDNGSSYLYINKIPSTGSPLSSTSHWQQIAEKGLKGDPFEYDDFTPEQLAGLVGNGIKSILRTSGDGTPGTTDSYTITFDDDSTTTFPVYNGADGDISNIKVDGATKTKAAGVVDLTSDFSRYSLWRKTASGNPVSVYPVPESPLYPKVSGTFTQAGTGDPSPENIRPITPWLASGASAMVKRTGKNLLNFDDIRNINADGSGAIRAGWMFESLGGKTVSVSYGPASSLEAGILLCKLVSNGVYGTSTQLYINSTTISVPVGSTLLIYAGSDTVSGANTLLNANNVAYIQLELGSTATPYEPYTSDAYEWTAPQDIYGLPGAETYVDWDARELVVGDALKVFNGTEAWELNTQNGNAYFLNLGNAKTEYYAEDFTAKNTIGLKQRPWDPLSGVNEFAFANKMIYVRTNGTDSLADWKAFLIAKHTAGTPVAVLYRLDTPIRTPLTDLTAIAALPQLDRTTPRQNVVTTSAGVLEVTYAEHTKFDFGRALDTAKSEKMMQYEHIPQMRFSGSMDGMTKEVPKVLRFEYRGAKNYINDSMVSGKRESGVVHTGYAEVKWQGTSSIAFPKKNFTVKLFEDEALTTKKKVALRATWGDQNKYCMKANFIDSTQCRNVVAAKVWGDMVRSRNTSSESYIRMHDLPNAGAVDGYPILVFLDDQYVGLYTMNIPKDEWTFGMRDGEGTNVVLCGESWTAPSMFNEPAVINGSDWGYEVEPADKSWVVNSFNGIYNALALPHGTEQEKTAKRAALEAVVDIYSVIDYQIFLEALCVTDNAGKNQLLVTYDGTKWIMSAYDLDTAFAMHWSGTQYLRNDAAPTTNNLTNTVRTLYPTDYNARKTALKTGALDPKRILQSVLNFAIDIPQEAYRAESELWPDQCGANTNAMQQIISFVMTRPDLNS